METRETARWGFAVVEQDVCLLVNGLEPDASARKRTHILHYFNNEVIVDRVCAATSVNCETESSGIETPDFGRN